MNRAWLLLLSSALASACLPGPEQIVDDANVELIVAGVTRNDQLTLVVDDATFSARGRADGVVQFLLALQPGAAEVSLTIERAAITLCASTSIDVPIEGRIVAAVDAAVATPCALPRDGPDDPGDDPDDPQTPDERDVLVHLQEIVVQVPPCTTRCAKVTTVTGDGVLLLQRDEDERSSQLSAEDLASLTAAALDDDADALFAGPGAGCTDPGPPEGETVSLERAILVNGEERQTTRIDATGCAGAAEELRKRLQLLCDVAFPDEC